VPVTVSESLRAAGIDQGEARVLLRSALGVGDDAVIASHPERVLSEAERECYEALVRRRARGEPVAYLTGEREFYSLAFHVSPAVLIPRPETELLVECALALTPAHAAPRVLDLGTGSGCVAIAIALQRPRASVTTTDVSREALALARRNAARHGARIEWAQGDWYQALAGRSFDLIVSNPPYVADGDPHLEQGDVRFEPRGALVAGPTGLECIEIVVEQSARHLAPGGLLLFEHGYDQGACARTLLAAAGFREGFTRRDLAGHERVSGGWI